MYKSPSTNITPFRLFGVKHLSDFYRNISNLHSDKLCADSDECQHFVFSEKFQVVTNTVFLLHRGITGTWRIKSADSYMTSVG